MHYLPPRKDSWSKAWLDIPASWPGGARRVKVLADYGNGRHGTAVWVKISGTDPYLPKGQKSYISEHLLKERK